MKVLFAVSNEEISESIVKKYQKEYKEIISYKNVYYFNAILKELQKDKTYDRVVISEDLETFTSTQYDQIDKFIFEKLDSISDEASNVRGNDIPIILICADRRTKSEQLLVKLFGIGIYDALIGNDRSIDQVCQLINKPRLKKEAKVYYKIDSEEVSYQAENENDVSEMEIQNIVAHYKRLGKNEDKYIDSFDNIAAQYNDTQLRIITKFLPLNVRAVLEERSPKYQQIMSFNNSVSDSLRYQIEKDEKTGPSETLLKQTVKERPLTEPIVIPSSVNMQGNRKLSKKKPQPQVTRPVETNINQNQINNNVPNVNRNNVENYMPNIPSAPSVQETENVNVEPQNNIDQNDEIMKDIQEQLTQYANSQKNNTSTNMETSVPTNTTNESSISEEPVAQPVKRGRGRPRKNPVPTEDTTPKVKRGRGRPRKNPIPEPEPEPEVEMNSKFDNILPGFEDVDTSNSSSTNQGRENEVDTMLPGFDETSNSSENMLPGFESLDLQSESVSTEPESKINDTENILPGFDEPVSNTEQQSSGMLPGMDDLYTNNNEATDTTFNNTSSTVLPGFDDAKNDASSNVNTNINEYDNSYNTNSNYNYNNNQFGIDNNYNSYNNNSDYNSNYQDQYNTDSFQYESNIDLSNLLTPDKKIATFVGTSKNGTSFIVNNIAEYMSSVMGVKTAILDTTRNRNSYYIYTKNEEELRNIAANSIDGLTKGIAKGIDVNKNLTVYTSLPDGENSINYVDEILETLLKNYSLILIDTDFNTPIGYFKQTQDLYLVQTLDILTIQPLTAFLRDLKSKNILDEQKLKIILNKVVKIRGVTEKTIVGGMAYYNDPAMSFMTELFDRNTVKYLTVPFEEEIYTKYLQGVIECEITLKGYSKSFNQTLGQLANMVYPKLTIGNSNTYTPPSMGNVGGNSFSSNMNSTLEQMRKKY